MSVPRRNESPTLAIDALSAVSGGGLSVARGLTKSLGELRPDCRILLVASHEQALPDRPPPNVECMLYPSARSTSRRWLFEQLSIPRLLRERNVDAMILLGGFRVFASRCPQIAVWQNAHIWSPPVETHTRKLSAYIALQRLVMRATLPRVAGNVFLSADSADRCGKHLGIEIPNVTIVPLGVDEAFTQRTEPPGFEDRDPVLLCVGDIYAHKRFELAIDALARLRDMGRSELELWIAGRFLDQACYDRLVGQVDRAALQGRVRFLGHVPRHELIELYRKAAVFLTSSRLEAFGLTPIEAMSCGLPVIACTDSAIPEVCGEAARYVDATGESIAIGVGSTLANPTEWVSLQRRGLERCRSFAWTSIAERYARVLQPILDGCGNPD